MPFEWYQYIGRGYILSRDICTQRDRLPLEARAFHTFRLIARQPPTSVTSLRSAHWLASDFTVGSIVGSTVKPMFTQFDCQSNSSTNRRINSWIDCSSNCQIHTQTLVGKLPVITGKTTRNWRRAVLSADAGLLVSDCRCTPSLRRYSRTTGSVETLLQTNRP